MREIDQQQVPTGYIITVVTDRACHLYLRWTLTNPRTHKDPELKRGAYFPAKVRFCFVEYEDNEQEEAGDTLTHTFKKLNWPICQTRYFYFWGTVAGESSPSETALFKKHFIGMGEYVISLGKLTEEEILQGHVKLKEGANVTITRDDPNNALIIAAAAAEPTPYEGFGNHFVITKIPVDTLDAPIWKADEIELSIKTLNHQLIVESAHNWAYQTHYPFDLIFNVNRGANVASSLTGFFGIQSGVADIIHNPTNPSVGVWLGGNRWYAHNGNGSNYTRTSLDTLSAGYAMCFRIVKVDSEIRWYVRGNLLVTHTTNIPDVWFGFKEHYSCRGDSNIRHNICCQRIKYCCGMPGP